MKIQLQTNKWYHYIASHPKRTECFDATTTHAGALIIEAKANTFIRQILVCLHSFMKGRYQQVNGRNGSIITFAGTHCICFKTARKRLRFDLSTL